MKKWSQEGDEYITNKKRKKANWIGHSFLRNCSVKQVIEGKMEGRIEATRRRGGRRIQTLDDLKEAQDDTANLKRKQ